MSWYKHQTCKQSEGKSFLTALTFLWSRSSVFKINRHPVEKKRRNVTWRYRASFFFVLPVVPGEPFRSGEQMRLCAAQWSAGSVNHTVNPRSGVNGQPLTLLPAQHGHKKLFFSHFHRSLFFSAPARISFTLAFIKTTEARESQLYSQRWDLSVPWDPCGGK